MTLAREDAMITSDAMALAGPAGNASYGDDDLAPGATFLDVPDGRRGLAERVGLVDGGCDFPDSMRSLRTLRSAEFSEAMNPPSFWLTSGESKYARSRRSVPSSHRPPVSPPTMTSLPRGGEGTTKV